MAKLSPLEIIYSNRRLDNQIKMEERLEEVLESIPEIESINNEISSLSASRARAAISGKELDVASLKAELDALAEKKKALLLSGGFDADYLDDIYTCEKCKDTGFINGKPCECRDKESIKLLYERSELTEVLNRENFDTFNFDFYSEDTVDENLGKDALSNIKEVVNHCHDFIDKFDTEFDNLLFFGLAGTGKTFLINCVAKELMDSFHSVIYLSASQLFDLMADQSFRNSNNSVYKNITLNDLRECDLLIIDDLGTEFTNSFTDSSLFDILNERLIHQKSTVISTNLSLEDFQERYDDRIFSRTAGYYSIFKIFGDDIRKLKKFS